MQNNQQMLTEFFNSLIEDNDISQRFLEEILGNQEVFSQKESSLLAIKNIYDHSWSGEEVAKILVELDYYTLWDRVDFNSDEEALYVEAKDLKAAYQLGFMICSKTNPDEAGFVDNQVKDYSYKPLYNILEEEEALKLGIEQSPDEYYYQPICVLRFWWD